MCWLVLEVERIVDVDNCLVLCVCRWFFLSFSWLIFNITSFAWYSQRCDTTLFRQRPHLLSALLSSVSFPFFPRTNGKLFHSVYSFVRMADLIKKLFNGFLSVSFLKSHDSSCVRIALFCPPNKNNIKLVRYTYYSYSYIFSFFSLRCIPPALFLIKKLLLKG